VAEVVMERKHHAVQKRSPKLTRYWHV